MEKIVTCILIDDDTDEHELFQMAISNCPFGVSCTCFVSCTEAITYLENKAIYPPDFIFMDWYLPVTAGKDCIADLTQISKLLTSKRVVYSGMSYQNQILGHINEQNIKFLAKQYSITELTKALVDIFQNF